MPSLQASTGLGIDLEEGLQSKPYPSDVELWSRCGGPRVRRALTGPRAQRPSDRQTQHTFGVPAQPPPMTASRTTEDSIALHSEKAMEGLRRAEFGDAMVAFDVTGGPMQEGSRFALDPITPRGGTVPRRHLTGPSIRQGKAAFRVLPRDTTLLDIRQSHTRNATELKTLLGDSNARLKSGAAVPPTLAQKTLDKKTRKEQTIILEQARSRARVEVDIVLQSNVCVQGGYIRGHVKVHVRRHGKKESPVLLAAGKVRIVGFETLPNDDERHAFYQFAVPLSSIAEHHHVLFDSPANEDGFAQAAQGVHVLPFCFQLPSDESFGTPKGVLSMCSGISVRYIAMVSIKVRDPDTGKRSLAHFYRNCEVWPHLDPVVILRPAPRPLQASTAKNISFLGGSAATRVKLSAQLPRLHWAAGTRCPVMLHVQNGSKKTIRSVVLTLVRTTTLFRPKPMLDADGDRDPDSCQTATTHKVMGEAFLEMSAGVTKGHASTKGWWTGVAPGQEIEFSHYIVLPPETLSVTRSRLVEVEYSVRVTVSAGSLTSDVSVTLPIRIFNFICIDPPPSASMACSASRFTHVPQLQASSNLTLDQSVSTSAVYAASPTSLCDEPEEYPTSMSYTSSLHVTNPDVEPPTSGSRPALVAADSEVSMSMYSTESDDADNEVSASASRVLSGVLELDEDVGSDEEVAVVMRSLRVGEGRFVSPAPMGMKGKRAAVANKGRMEGVGSGMKMTGFSKRVQDKQRLREKMVANANSNIDARYGYGSSASEEEASSGTGADETPRLGYRAPRPSDSSTGDETDPSARPSRQLPRPPTIPPNGSSSTTGESHKGYTTAPRSMNSVLDSASMDSARLVEPPAAAPRPPPIPPNGSASATNGSHDGYTVPPALRRGLGPDPNSSSEDSMLEPSYLAPPPATTNRSPYVRSRSPMKPTHTFIRHQACFTPSRPQTTPASLTSSNHNPSVDAYDGLPNLPHPPSVSAYPSDPELLRMAILRPPARLAPTVCPRQSSGSGTSGCTSDGVKGRIAALEERMRAARLSGDAYY